MWRRPLALLLAGLAPAFGAGDPSKLLGTWSPADDPAAVVELTHSAPDKLVGHLVAHAEHPEHVGTPIFRELRYDPDTARWQGEIYSVRLKKWFAARLSRPADRAFSVEVRAWFLTRSVDWVRVPEPPDPER